MRNLGPFTPEEVAALMGRRSWARRTHPARDRGGGAADTVGAPQDRGAPAGSNAAPARGGRLTCRSTWPGHATTPPATDADVAAASGRPSSTISRAGTTPTPCACGGPAFQPGETLAGPGPRADARRGADVGGPDGRGRPPGSGAPSDVPERATGSTSSRCPGGIATAVVHSYAYVEYLRRSSETPEGWQIINALWRYADGRGPRGLRRAAPGRSARGDGALGGRADACPLPRRDRLRRA